MRSLNAQFESCRVAFEQPYVLIHIQCNFSNFAILITYTRINLAVFVCEPLVDAPHFRRKCMQAQLHFCVWILASKITFKQLCFRFRFQWKYFVFSFCIYSKFHENQLQFVSVVIYSMPLLTNVFDSQLWLRVKLVTFRDHLMGYDHRMLFLDLPKLANASLLLTTCVSLYRLQRYKRIVVWI